MRRVLLLILLVLGAAPVVLGQGFLQVSSLNGKAEIRVAGAGTFQSLTSSTRQVQVGDQIRTGPGASVVLTLPDFSYMVVSENTDMVIQDFWSGGLRSTVNLMLGRIRFYINAIGGRPNPYRVQTPTALIAVRGTTFDVVVDQAQFTEVWCFEGQVAVESAGLSDREVILNPGWHTLVSPGRYPVPPVPNDIALVADRTLKVVKKGQERENKVLDPKGLERLIRDNDRMNRPSDRSNSPASQWDSNVGRAKPSVTFP
jgi:ferric-dicitrate binding protein FerR (iron transport regulator)